MTFSFKRFVWPRFASKNFLGNFVARKRNDKEVYDDDKAKLLPLRRSLKVQFIEAKDTSAFGDILCDSYELSGNFTLNDIEQFVRKHRASHPDHRLFATLDDFDQACYTFGHACGHHLQEEQIEGLWEADNIRDVLTFELRVSNFQKRLRETLPHEIKAKRSWQAANSLTGSLKTDNWPEYENKSYVQIVPVSAAAETLIAFPNGYFSGDYTPFENYRLAEFLDKEFGFELFGIGAAYIGFMRQTPLIEKELDNLILWLSGLFSKEDKTDITAYLRRELENKSTFYLCYAER